jgi:hypothetical protein
MMFTESLLPLQKELLSYANMLPFIKLILHFIFATGVAKDAGLYIKQQHKTALVSPMIWVLSTLVFGIWVAFIYFLIHHSTFTRPYSKG